MEGHENSFLNRMYEKRKITAVIFAVCILSGLGFGCLRARANAAVTEQEAAEIRAYEEKLQEYDSRTDELRVSLAETDRMITELNSYSDQAVYMKLDPSSVKQISVQYLIKYAKGADSSEVNKAILSYITDGGFQKAAGNDCMPENECWEEVLSASAAGKVLTVTLLHYDWDKAGEVMKQIREKLTEYASVSGTAGGEFSAEEICTQTFEKSDYSIAITQNKKRNLLRSYYRKKADIQKKLGKAVYAAESYRTGSRPKVLNSSKSGSFTVIIASLLVGITAAFIISAVYMSMLTVLQRKDERL